MSQYFSKVYRGFLIEQTDRGWIVPQLPKWSNGPVSQGPFSTYQIACHVLDRVLDNESTKPQKKESQPTKTSGPSSPTETGPVEYLTLSKEIILYFVAYPLIVIFALSALFTFLSLFVIGKSPIQFVLILSISILSYFLSKKVLNYVYS